MTAPALLYRPNARWQICLAFGCAASLHLAAIALARSVPEIPSFPQSTDSGVEAVIDPAGPDTGPPCRTNSDRAIRIRQTRRSISRRKVYSGSDPEISVSFGETGLCNRSLRSKLQLSEGLS